MSQRRPAVDLDRYREPSRDPAALADRRAALLDQLGWLADEAAALAPLLSALPAWALEETPLPGERSVKETLAHLAALDRDGHGRWVAQFADEEHPVLAPVEESAGAEAGAEAGAAEANGRALDDLVGDLRRARADLLDRLEALPEAAWAREATLDGAPVTLHDLLLRVVRHDADLLRALAYRLHEAKLSTRRS